MRRMLVLLVVVVLAGCRSQGGGGPSPAREQPRLPAATYVAPTITPALVAALPDVEDDEPKIGGVIGIVLDTNNEPLVGAVLVATAESFPPQTVITDEDGMYLIDQLPPDDYLVTLYYVDQTSEYRTTVGDELVDLSPTIEIRAAEVITFTGCGVSMENRYVVDGIDTTGLTFGE